MKKDTGGPAFPTDDYYDERRVGQFKGMTLRDYFAAKALPENLRVLGACDFSGPEECAAEVARLAYIMADAMLTERNK